MIHVVTHFNRRAYAIQLNQLARILRREHQLGISLASLKCRARPTLRSDDGAYLLMVDEDGPVRFGVSLRSSAASESIHRRLPNHASFNAPAPEIWECLFFTDRRRTAGTGLLILEAFWTAALRAAAERGAERLVGIDLGGRQRGVRKMFDVDCKIYDQDLTALARDGVPPVISLDAETAAKLTATEVERLLRGLSGKGSNGYAAAREILDLALHMATTEGAKTAIERIEGIGTHALTGP